MILRILFIFLKLKNKKRNFLSAGIIKGLIFVVGTGALQSEKEITLCH